MDWINAIFHCYNKNVGGRKGWRLPTVEELMSLVDPTQSNPALPAGHPFTNVQSDLYWSVTTFSVDPDFVKTVNFNDGRTFNHGKLTNFFHVWCVRGGHGYDAY